jgi:hypothetical protein
MVEQLTVFPSMFSYFNFGPSSLFSINQPIHIRPTPIHCFQPYSKPNSTYLIIQSYTYSPQPNSFLSHQPSSNLLRLMSPMSPPILPPVLPDPSLPHPNTSSSSLEPPPSPTNTHSMVTRSKNGISKKKILHTTTTKPKPDYLQTEPPNLTIASKILNGQLQCVMNLMLYSVKILGL